MKHSKLFIMTALAILSLFETQCSILPDSSSEPPTIDEYCSENPLRQSCPAGNCAPYPCIEYCLYHYPDGLDIPDWGLGSWCDLDLDYGAFCAEHRIVHSCPDWCQTHPGQCTVCGNGLCEGVENGETCPQECGTQSRCHDRTCSDDENASICPEDCPSVCGDGFVTHNEDCEPGDTRSCATPCDSEDEESGTQECTTECGWGDCLLPEESCNGSDDDCDGEVDEGFDCVLGSETPCETTCGTTGSRICQASCSWSTECTPPEEVGNGIDDDCDGEIDRFDGLIFECADRWVAEIVTSSDPREGDFVDLWGSSWDNIFAITSMGYIYSFDGEEWTGAKLPDPAFGEPRPRSIWGLSEDNVYVVGEAGYVAHFDGTSWSSLNSGSADHFNAIHGRTAESMYIVGDRGSFYRYDGSDFYEVITGTTQNLNDIFVTTRGREESDFIIAVGDEGTIIRGSTSLNLDASVDVSDDFNAVWGRNAFELYITGSHGTYLYFILLIEDSVLDSSEEQFDIFGFELPGSFLYTAGGSGRRGQLLRYEGGDVTYAPSYWVEIDEFTSHPITAIWGSSEYNIFATAGRTLYHHCGSGW